MPCSVLRSLLGITIVAVLVSCSPGKSLQRSARTRVLGTAALETAHVGISVFEPATGKYWYDYQGDHYFIPASNTKIPTCYAAMKYLGDSLAGIRYGFSEPNKGNESLLVIDPTGDPTFLHPDFKSQRVFSFLQQNFSVAGKRLGWLTNSNKIEPWGNGWSWNDYEDDYMAERSVFPVYGNLINVRLLDTSQRRIMSAGDPARYGLFSSGIRLFDSLLNNLRPPMYPKLAAIDFPAVKLRRKMESNDFWIEPGTTPFKSQIIPFATRGFSTAAHLLLDTLKADFTLVDKLPGDGNRYTMETDNGDVDAIRIPEWKTLYSQPTDSFLRPLMHVSDNFFAEQALLMTSDKLLGEMNDGKIVDTLLKTDFRDLPQKPRWVDGSGLSRYNLFSPRDFVMILDRMRNEFGMERVKTIFPTGGEGTLSSYYKTEAGFLYAKTGTLSGVVALSGFLYTRKNKLLVFSVLVNNHNHTATEVRRAVESFLREIRSRY